MTRQGKPPVLWLAHAQQVLALEAIAVTAWLLPASVHIVSWPASGPVRLALLSPTWQLLVWLAAGAFAHGALTATRRDASAVLSYALPLWALVVPFLPWLPDRLPLLLVLAGPLKWVLIAVSLVRAVLLWTPARRALESVWRMRRRDVFVVSLVIYVGFGLWTVGTNGLGGDEPHYLVITESLMRDGDLAIGNNHQRGDYRSFFQGELRPDFMQRGTNGEIYSIHAPGLPALVLPVYALAGYRGAVAFVALLAALAAMAIFDLANSLAGRRVAVLTWTAVCLTVPFVPHSWALFPEMPGALLVAWATAWLMRPGEERSATQWFMRGVALAWLPWLHTKFVVFLAIFAVGLGLQRLVSRRWSTFFALAAPIAVSCAAWLYSFYAIYGTVNPEAPYGAYTSIYVLTRNIPHGLLGLFFDQKFGLLFYSPIYMLVLAGAWLALRDRRERFAAVVLLAVIAAYVGSTARLYMFWGGSSAPARFFVPLLPCLAPFVALGWSRCTSTATRALAGLWLAIGLGVAAVGIVSPARLLLFSDPHGRARLLELIQGASPLARVVPTFTDPDWATQVGPLGWWLLAAALSLGVLVLFAAVRTQRSAWSGSALVAGTFLFIGAVVTARPEAAVREATATRGALDVLWRYDGDRFRTLDYQRLARTPPDRLRELTTLHVQVEVPPEARAPFESSPLTLPPGVFDASVWFKSALPREGAVLVAGPRAVFGEVRGLLGNPARFEVAVPVVANRVVVRIPELDVARGVSEVWLVPRAVVPPSAREQRPVRMIESLPGDAGGQLVYTDGEAYPEMGTFWSRGTAATTVLIAPGRATRMTLVLFTGPMDGTVTVTSGGRSERVAMAARQERSLTIAVPPGQSLVPVTIQSSVMFRPGEVDPSISDMRGLGCQVRIALE